MKFIWARLIPGRLAQFFRFVSGTALVLVAAGCHVLPPMPNAVQDMGPRYHPVNVYRREAVLPPQIRRVALLPITATGKTAFMQAGVETLEPLLYAELVKCKRFEVIPVTPEELRQWTGKTGWRTDEPLPAEFFDKVTNAAGCEGVLFTQLTRYDPYQPVAVGWKLCLVSGALQESFSSNALPAEVFWAADEILDSGEPGVANAARDYSNQHLRNENPSADISTILNSPTRFGQYTLAALLSTLPARPGPSLEKAAKVTPEPSR